MDEFRLPLRGDYERNPAESWDECCLCGKLRRNALVHFDSGSVAPTADTVSAGAWSGGETVTGATSADTGVVHKVVKTSGTWAGGDAAGILILRSPTGYDDCNLDIFQDNESLNGSVAGSNFATVDHTGTVSTSGRLIPSSDLIEYEGKKYCKAHFPYKYRNKWQNDERPDINENDRGDE